MKPDTEYHYEFLNAGNRADRQTGTGNYMRICLAQAAWLKSITMNGAIRINITRELKTTEDDAFQAMLDEMTRIAEEPSDSAESV